MEAEEEINIVKNKKFIVIVLSGLAFCLVAVMALTVWIDPYFHYHEPIEGISYYMAGERYLNDGITRNFEYDAVITGTSMIENFKTSEFNKLFDVNAIKVPYSGARNKEIGDNLGKSLRSHNVKIVLRCLDYNYLLTDKDEVNSNINYPYYITNDDLFDDVNYIYNKDVFLKYIVKDLINTLLEKPSTNFDDYTSWDKIYNCDRKQVLEHYERKPSINQVERLLTEQEKIILDENLEQNILSTIREYPNTEFYLYFAPYSICYWDDLCRTGELKYYEEVEMYTIEKLLQCSNVHLYSFNDRLDVITNLDNYMDIHHYGAHINSEILRWMKNDEGLITSDNYKQYISNCYSNFYTYDYDSIYE